MDVDAALKWADTWGKVEEGSSGDQMALDALAREVRKLAVTEERRRRAVDELCDMVVERNAAIRELEAAKRANDDLAREVRALRAGVERLVRIYEDQQEPCDRPQWVRDLLRGVSTRWWWNNPKHTA